MRAATDANGYTFGIDGKLITDRKYLDFGGNTYYTVNNTVVYNYRVIQNRIYYFGTDGIMIKDTEHDGNTLGSDGYIVGDCAFITIEGDTYDKV